MEKIYTIPVNEAFDEKRGCPFCRMREKLEKNEIDLILGASMMEPDIRIQTNEKGFCERHYHALFFAQKRLPLALMLESHLAEIEKKCRAPLVSLKDKTRASSEAWASFSRRCYVCDRTAFHLEKMFETACLLWDQDSSFRRKFDEQPYFCLPCYTHLLETASNFVSKKTRGDFLDAAQKLERSALSSLQEDISWFCKKFDYRYADEPWKNSRDAVERTLRFLRGESTVPQEEDKT